MRRLAAKFEVVETVTPEGRVELAYANRPKNLEEMLSNTVSKYGDKEALITENERITYKQFASAVENMASALYHKYGVRKGDRIALLLSNGTEIVVSFFALAKIGAITVTLNTRLKGEELAFQINDSDATILITELELYERLAGVRSEIKRIKLTFLTDSQPEGTLPFSELLNPEEGKPVNVRVDETASIVIMYTSGTTGMPKGALLTHKGMIASAMNIAQLRDWRVGRDKMLSVVPLFHVTGLILAVLTSVLTGIPAVIIKRFKAVDTLKIIEDEKITAMAAVPTIFWLMLNDPEFKKYDISSLRLLAVGGSAIAPDLVLRWTEKVPDCQFLPGYGLTESCSSTHTITSSKEALEHIGSVGWAMPLVEAKIVNSEGKEVPPGEAGEILLRGCQMIREYWNNPKATKEAVVGGWLHTGDIGKINEDGYTYILDRIKDMINRGGEKIFSIEVENVLYRHPKILEVAVLGIPDPVFDEQVKAVIVPRPGEEITPEEIQEFCGKHLANYKIPRFIEFRDSLPRNPGGKVIKGELK